MRHVVLALALTLTAVPALAGGVSIDLPRLSWAQAGQPSSSTKGCEPATQPTAALCK